jgi:hypothetical protein
MNAVDSLSFSLKHTEPTWSDRQPAGETYQQARRAAAQRPKTNSDRFQLLLARRIVAS